MQFLCLQPNLLKANGPLKINCFLTGTLTSFLRKMEVKLLLLFNLAFVQSGYPPVFIILGLLLIASMTLYINVKTPWI